MSISVQQSEFLFSRLRPESVSVEMLCPGMILGDDLNKISSLQELFPEQATSRWQMRIKELPNDGRKLEGVALLGNLPAVIAHLTNDDSKVAAYEVGMECQPKSILGFDTMLDGVSEGEIAEMIMDLKHTEREKWGEILREWLVTSVVYTNSMTISFTNNGVALNQDELTALKGMLEIGTEHSWDVNGRLELFNCMLPVSMGGFVVKGYEEYTLPVGKMRATA